MSVLRLDERRSVNAFVHHTCWSWRTYHLVQFTVFNLRTQVSNFYDLLNPSQGGLRRRSTSFLKTKERKKHGKTLPLHKPLVLGTLHSFRRNLAPAGLSPILRGACRTWTAHKLCTWALLYIYFRSLPRPTQRYLHCTRGGSLNLSTDLLVLSILLWFWRTRALYLAVNVWFFWIALLLHLISNMFNIFIAETCCSICCRGWLLSDYQKRNDTTWEIDAALQLRQARG